MKDIYRRTGIYGIKNKVNNNIYIGKTLKDFGDRWDTHRAMLNGGYHYNVYLQNEWNEYGSDAFDFIIIEDCNDENTINGLERKYIDNYRSDNCCYNILDGGDDTPNIGRHLSDEAKRKIGEKNRINMTGRKMSEGTKSKKREKMVEFWDGVSDEYKNEWARVCEERNKGRKWSESAKKNFSETQKTSPNGAKYTIDDVCLIRRLHERENKTYSEIADLLSIPRGTVYNIATYRRWKHIDG